MQHNWVQIVIILQDLIWVLQTVKFLIIVLCFNTVKFIPNTTICWTTERIFSRQTFLEKSLFGNDGNIVFY